MSRGKEESRNHMDQMNHSSESLQNEKYSDYLIPLRNFVKILLNYFYQKSSSKSSKQYRPIQIVSIKDNSYHHVYLKDFQLTEVQHILKTKHLYLKDLKAYLKSAYTFFQYGLILQGSYEDELMKEGDSDLLSSLVLMLQRP